VQFFAITAQPAASERLGSGAPKSTSGKMSFETISLLLNWLELGLASFIDGRW
jgi:hypothetical protein